MNCFPMFIDLQDREVLVCGSGSRAEEKIRQLIPYGPRITVIGDGFSELDLASHPVFVVVASNREENRRIAGICRRHHVPVNAVDQPEDCDFVFPAILKEGDLTVAIGTNGKSPAAAAELRKRIAGQIPGNVAEILTWLSDLRQKMKDMVPALRRQALGRIVQEDFRENRPLTREEVEDICK